MARGKRPNGPVDALASIEIAAYPWNSHTVVEVALGRSDGDGRSKHRIAYWHIGLTRADLHGRSTDDVLRLLCEHILHRLESGDQDPADRVARAADSLAGGPGAPLGATGGTVTQDCLPGI